MDQQTRHHRTRRRPPSNEPTTSTNTELKQDQEIVSLDLTGPYRDVAEVAATAFATDELVNGTFELAAGAMITRTELAQTISRHAGRDVTAVDLNPADALAEMPDGYQRDGLTDMFADYTAHGFHGGNNLVLRTILGRAPRSLDNFFAELAH